MLKDVHTVRHVGGYRLHVRFEDGREGDVDVSKLVQFRAIFEPLKDQAFFSRVRVDPDVGTIVWPNGADIDPDVLYATVVGEPIPRYGDEDPPT